jgi:hypothetical protein
MGDLHLAVADDAVARKLETGQSIIDDAHDMSR